jgi:Xaa-Pro aminopeptidase
MTIERTADETLLARLRETPPINMGRAHAVMERNGLSGIVLSDPLNIFHATGFWPQMARIRAGQPPITFVLIAADETQHRGFVASHFAYYYTFVDSRLGVPLQTYLYDQHGDSFDGVAPDDRTQDPQPAALQDRGATAPDATEAHRATALRAALDAGGCARDAGEAVVRALRGMGMWNGRVAFDHPVIAAICERHGRPGTLMPGDNIMREIRLIKSPLEVALMKRASAGNVAAALATAAAIRDGASFRDINDVYVREATAHGNVPVFLNIDRVCSSYHDAPLREGQALMIDAVSHFHNYHGDYGRTIFIGEPAGEARRAADAAQLGWTAVREMLRPGVRYSQIVAAGRSALAKAGYDFPVLFTPHSVGLLHTDEPCRTENGFYVKDDLVLEAGMILSVDCPVLATGLGGSVHLEDLVVIDEDGCTPIHDVGPAVICV